MKVLITSAGARLSQALAASLSRAHDVRLTDVARAASDNVERCDLGHDDATNALVAGMDVIVHSGETDPEADESARLDAATRCTYNLLWAAAQEGVHRVVYLSSLRLMHGYAEDLAVTERWRPVPDTDVETLGYHLGEFVCREFARERKLDVVCLRLGDLAYESEADSTSSLLVSDAVQAVEKALDAEFPARENALRPTWNLLHVQSSVLNARYLTRAAQDALGYAPAVRG